MLKNKNKELAASLIEYCFAVVLIMFVAIAAVKTFAGSVNDLFTTSNAAM